MNKVFFQVVVEYVLDSSLLEDINRTAFSEFNCGGSQVFDFNEQQVDYLLGSDAYVGGELPEKVLAKIDTAQATEKDSHVFFFYDESAQESATSFCSYLKNLDSEKLVFNIEKKAWEDWNQEWKKHYKPIVVSDRINVFPSWLKDNNDTNKIWINPGMGFGTGTHETTFLCLGFYDSFIEKFSKMDDTLAVLDLGCGSGILGIAAKKFTKCNVDFCDIDTDALDNCVENLALNFIDGELDGSSVCSREKLVKNKRYNFIFANILEPVLIAEQKTILAASLVGTDLIISGLLEEQFLNIVNTYAQDGWKLIEKRDKNGWVALHLNKEC